MTSTTATRMTAEQFLALPESERREQLIDGVLVAEVTGATYRHERLVRRVLVALDVWTRAEPRRGEAFGSKLDVRLGDRDVYEPDVLWVSADHIPDHPSGRLQRVPDLVVEVRSPGTWRFDVGRKLRTYETSGAPEVWLVDDISESVLVFRRSRPAAPDFDVALELSGDDALTSPQLPGFALTLKTLFATP
jgi:Uma2 family endonuclease